MMNFVFKKNGDFNANIKVFCAMLMALRSIRTVSAELSTAIATRWIRLSERVVGVRLSQASWGMGSWSRLSACAIFD